MSDVHLAPLRLVCGDCCCQQNLAVMYAYLCPDVYLQVATGTLM